MAQNIRPPFRGDHVGSLLRPARLKEARENLLGAQTADSHLGPHNNADLAKIEDDCIRDVIALQEKAGLIAATDGEFRRRSWWLELIMTWSGVTANRQDSSSPFGWKNEQGKQQDFSHLHITGKIEWQPSAVVKAFEFLRDNTRLVPKVTIPSPPVIHCFSGGDPMILDDHYDDMEEFWDDLIAAYRQEIQALVAAGARYIQMDDVTLPFICDPDYGDVFRSWGSGPEQVLDDYARRMNQILEGLPDDVTITMHQCRGNREGLWSAEGGYDPVADVLFNQINVHGYFLEYDTPRAGTFEPLRLLPEGKVVALGIVSTKTPKLEDVDFLKRRIDEAAQYAPLERLSLATQCGFASSIVGNPLSEDDEAAKLARIVEVADDVWGTA
ncbi:MAG: 5-methyltetrahydropteroyltriglutamate--homocysteine S-methyltransferase [Rhodospirillaceae bacterium]|jgi:5-methyltetrahydropteroyltriglutamate--homocysteine methyltransferase|nr:5-methyltetrahydropteroyltriglutamate--homocysteine S-methyltransferase [Rhodospirillaceae bacterium]MBT5454964.1 5-methyltetrahydropteroyltriglutamate--homocysteine S-methyltransferase [Rhodospirillaceae bacterium]